MTAADLIARSLRLVGVLAGGETATGDEANDALATLNDLLDTWASEGPPLDAIPAVPTLATVLALEPGYAKALRFALAVELAPEYGKPLDGWIVQTALEAKAVLKRRAETIGELTVDRALLGFPGSAYDPETDEWS